jgi:glycosyltransferase involved in cell wall biosynthesis
VDGRAAVEPSVFVLFRDSPLRRAALDAEPGSAERFWLFGADQLAERGFSVRHSLEPGLEPARRHRLLDRALRAGVRAAGGYGGDFATVLACRRAAGAADAVFSTVDTVGIPLALLSRARLVGTPFVYASIGLLERIEQLRSRLAHRVYKRALAAAAVVIAYGHAEAEALRAWFRRAPSPPDVRFVPFGVDTGYFRPRPDQPSDVDVLALGADPRRDYELLARVAAELPDRRFAVVASPDQARALAAAPATVSVESDLPFADVRERLARARVVALPVRENRYTGATTTLLQAMAMAKPVVVSRTAAIGAGYGLADGENCRLVEPADQSGFAAALGDLLADRAAASQLGANARATVERHLTWETYVDAIADALRTAARSTMHERRP